MLTLTIEQQVLFSLLLGERITDAPGVDWNIVMREAQAQSVFLMLKQPENLPVDIAEQWHKKYYTLMKENIREFYAVSEMNRIMGSIKQRYVILKGISSAYYYPDIFSRALGDVDFLIDPNQQSEIVRALVGASYKAQKPAEHHIAFMKGKQDLEMHFTIPGMPKGEPGEHVQDYIKDILDDRIAVNVNGTKVDLPQPKYHGLVILLHMQQHMTSGGFGLRHLIDWCYFVNKTIDEPFWDVELIPVLKEIGMFYYAQVMTKTGAMYLHTVEPEWCKNADEKLCDLIMRDILTGGNFGRKNMARAESSLMLTKYKNGNDQHSHLYKLWKTLFTGAACYHPIVKKCPILYPVFIIDFLFRRFKHVIRGERQPLWQSAKYVKERESVYEKLHLFEV